MITLLCILGISAFIKVFATMAGVIFALTIVFMLFYGLGEAIKHGKWLLIVIFVLLLL